MNQVMDRIEEFLLIEAKGDSSLEKLKAKVRKYKESGAALIDSVEALIEGAENSMVVKNISKYIEEATAANATFEKKLIAAIDLSKKL